MTGTAVVEAAAPDPKAVVLYQALCDEEERLACERHPALLLDRVSCVDATTGEQFRFQLLDESDGWYWRRQVLEHWLGSEKSIILKARQLGITWLAAGLALWTVLYKPGARVLVISINEEEASKVVNRLWDMLESLPEHLRNATTVIKPARNSRPTLHIELREGCAAAEEAWSNVLALRDTCARKMPTRLPVWTSC